MRSIEIKASSVEKATEEGLSQLGISKENAEVEVVSEGGLFSKAVVRISEKERPGDRAREFLKTLFEKMRLNCEVGCESEDGVIKVSITGPDSGIAIGYRGEVLDAIQYLTLLIANEGEDKFEKVVINAENYREKREKTLEGLAKKLGFNVFDTGAIYRGLACEFKEKGYKSIDENTISDFISSVEVKIFFEGAPVEAEEGESVAAALQRAGVEYTSHHGVTGEHRAPAGGIAVIFSVEGE